MIEINKIKTPFIYYCQKVIPLAFDESLSYYEQLCHLTAKIKEVIENQNIEGQAIEELQEKYLLLVDYVDNYFENLDIQEEINNKLDEMALDGTLENLIGQYIQLATTYCYDNITSMKNATNLVNGSYAKTYGFYSKNDGGASYYLIRNVENDDDIDEITLIALNDPLLVAELIKEKTMSPSQFGAKGDGETDDTLSINTCIDYADNILFNQGTYLINPIYDSENPDDTCINLKSNKVIDFNNATITMDATDNSLYYLIRGYQVNNIVIKNGIIQGYDDTAPTDSEMLWGVGIAIMDCSNIVIENMKVNNCRGDGIYIREYSNQKKTNNVLVNNCILLNNRNNGIGYTGGANVKITNCYCEINSTPSETYSGNGVGIDIERDHDYARFENFYINNCNFKNQPNCGISISPVNTGIPCYGTIENCNIENCTYGIRGTRGGKAGDSVYVRNINISGCTLPPISMSRGNNNMNITFENIVVNSFTYTGVEDLNYMFYMPGVSGEGVSNVSIINPVCKANCPLVFMNNGINNVALIDPIFENGQSDNSWGVLHGRTASSKLILKDSFNQVRMTINTNYENSNISTPSNILINGQGNIINVTILRNLLCEGNEITIFNKGIYKTNIILQGNRQITIPEYQGYCRVIKMNDELMFYGNLTKYENLPQS